MEAHKPSPPSPRFGSPKKEVPSKKQYKITLSALVIVILFLLCWIGTRPEIPGPAQKESSAQLGNPSDRAQPIPKKSVFSFADEPANASAPQKTLEASGGFALEEKSTGACRGLIPNDWRETPSPRSDAADFLSMDGTMYAGYVVFGVNPAMQIYDPELYSENPETSVRRFAQVIIEQAFGDRSILSFTGEYNQMIGEYAIRSVESSDSKGVVFYRIFPGDGFNSRYIEVVRFGLARKEAWNTRGLLVARIAASIECATQLVARDLPVVGGGSSDRSTTDENGDDYGYNPQLGTEYAHDDNGTNYLVSPSLNWSTTGPEGEGYYHQAGNEVVKLKAGRSD